MPTYLRRKEKFRLFHFRLFAVVAIMALSAIFLLMGSLALRIIALFLLVGVLVIPYFRKSFDRALLLPIFLIFFIFLLYTPIRFAIANAYTLDSGEYTFTARVGEVSYVYGGKGEVDYYLLTDIKVDGKKYNGDCKIKLKYNDFKLGDVVEAKGYITSEKVSFDGNQPSANYLKGIRYQATVYQIFGTGANKKELSEIVQEKARTLFEERLGYKVGGFCTSMLLGGTDKMSYEDTTAFRHSGTAHVFAVSGLHVGVLIGGFLFIMRKLRFKPIVKIAIAIPILIFYAYLTGFSPSVLRATVMVLYGLSAEIGGNRHDFITSIAFSAIVVLLVNPLYAFSVSFQLSYCAVLGIAGIQPPLKRYFKRKKIPLAEALALSCSTSFAITPLSIYYFSWFSALSIILNVIVIPIISVLYVLVLCEFFLAMIIPSFKILSRAIYYVGGTIMDGISMANDLPFIGFEVQFTPFLVILTFVILLLISEQCLLSNKHKKWIGTLGTMFTALVAAFSV